MTVKLLTEHHLEFLSFKGGCTGSSGSTLVKMPHCWKSHAAAHFIVLVIKSSVGKLASSPMFLLFLRDSDIICPRMSVILPSLISFLMSA